MIPPTSVNLDWTSGDGRVTIFAGDCVESMRRMDAESVHCCVTSPPYWGLRDYGTAKWEGGDPACDHKAPSRFDYQLNPGLGPVGAQTQSSNGGSGSVQQFKSVCGKCGAVRKDSQLGLEPTPDEYVAGMVAVFREVRRVLRDDGTLWLNLGDSYAAGSNNKPNTGILKTQKHHQDDMVRSIQQRKPAEGLKPKDLVGIPWRVAFALQADGWYLRQDIIWHKPNPMPESVTDRCTKAHEYIFLLSKSERYCYDAKAIAEKAIHAGHTVKKSDPNTAKNAAKGQYGATAIGFTQHDTVVGETRNKRSVWTVTAKPYKGAHFATFPPDLIEPCILAGCPEGGTVLDPFGGSGTTACVAMKHGRFATLCELNPEYITLARRRLAATVPDGVLFGATA